MLRQFMLVTVLVVLLGATHGCGGDEPAKTNEEANEAAPVEPPQQALEQATPTSPAEVAGLADLIAALHGVDLTAREDAAAELVREITSGIDALGAHAWSNDPALARTVTSGFAMIDTVLTKAMESNDELSHHIPPALTPAQIEAMSDAELREALNRVTEARSLRGLNAETSDRLREEWKQLMLRLKSSESPSAEDR